MMDAPRVTPEELAVLLGQQSEPSQGSPPATDTNSLPTAASRVAMTIELAHGLVETRGLITLRPGDIIHLGQHVTEPVDILIDDVFVARGRVLNVDGQLCVEVLDFTSANGEDASSL